MKQATEFSSRCRLAFTLVELLVVVSLLGVLTALLMAGLGAMRRQGENATCVQRLKTSGTALLAYAADHQGMVLPRLLGHLRDANDPPKPPSNDAPWPNRLIRRGYASADSFYCPSFTPRSNAESDNQLPKSGYIRTYGLRTWVVPGQEASYNFNKAKEEAKPLTAIKEPADFFLIVDSVWKPWKSQGYGIAPGLQNEQLVHLRHSGRANAFFADGHVESKPASYFSELHLKDRQAAYSGDRELPFGVTSQLVF